jgi:hypothetical protein
MLRFQGLPRWRAEQGDLIVRCQGRADRVIQLLTQPTHTSQIDDGFA